MILSHHLELLLSLSLFLSFFPAFRLVLFPIQIFTTWVHECSHALAAFLLGGTSIKITLSKDGSGLTYYKIPAGKLKRSLIASSGYLGASLFGCILFSLSIFAERGSKLFTFNHLIICLCTLMSVSLLIWVRNLFGSMSIFVLGTALASLLYSPMNQYAAELILFLAIQTALNALFDIRILFSIGNQQRTTSDAHTLQALFYLPAWFWAGLWLVMSGGMMGFSLVKLNLT